MLQKINIALLLIFIGVKGFSQITMPNQSNVTIDAKNKYATIEIKENMRIGKISTILFYSDGKTEKLSDVLYTIANNKYLPDIKTSDYEEDESIAEPLKALVCIQYMAERNYTLISSNATNWDGVFRYQYIFERKEK